MVGSRFALARMRNDAADQGPLISGFLAISSST